MASWIFYLAHGMNEQGQPLNIIDARRVELAAIAKRAPTDPSPLLAVKSIFGEKLPSNATFVHSVKRSLQMLANDGVTATMRANFLSSPLA